MPSASQITIHQEGADYKDHCRKMQYLVARQRELCTLSKNLLQIVSKGEMKPFETQYKFC